MMISVRWLKTYLNFEISIPEIIEGLTFSGLEVEQTFDLGMLSNKILVAKILSIDPHPQADNLSLCKVSIGGDDALPIVCGATNMKSGDLVPLALDGAVLPGGQEIRKTKIRGEESEGMLCSGAELNYGQDAEGLLILPDNWKIGTPFDFLLDIKVTPNRPDCLSIFGIARDLAATRGKKIYPPQHRVAETMERVEQHVRIQINDKDGCPRYTARALNNVKVAPSPPWLARAVESAGLRSINNVVDVTNYVLLEMGHPLHAFDLEKLANHEIIVRYAKDGEKITTLDEEDRTLTSEDLLITTPAGPVALAGIMGGMNSEISDSTTSVLLECAYFDPTVIRKTAKRLDIQTESSYRFERGADRESLTIVLNRATHLLREVSGGEVLRGTLDVSATYIDRTPITMDIKRVNTILGLNLSSTEIADIMVLLGCEIKRSDRNQLLILPPSYRVDLEGEHDLIEEVARIYGYNKIESRLPTVQSKPYTEERSVVLADELKNTLRNLGFHEVVNYTFVSREDIERYGLGADNTIEILNPLSREQAIMRPSLGPGILNCVSRNHSRNIFNFQLMELGKVFWYSNGSEQQPHEEVHLMAVLSGGAPAHWYTPARPYDFFMLKGVVERMLADLGISTDAIKKSQSPNFHPGQSAELYSGDQLICTFGRLHPRLAQAWDLRRDVWLVEGNVDKWTHMPLPRKSYSDFGRYPSILRDFAILIDRDLPAGEIENIMRVESGELLENLQVFDLYEGKGVPEGKKSVGFTLTLRSDTGTLTDEEANAIQDRIIGRLEKELSATLRSN